MLLKKIWMVLIAGAVLGGMVPVASGQTGAHSEVPPTSNHTEPAEFYAHHNYRPFETADLSMYGNGPDRKEGFFFDYDRVVWAFNRPKSVPVGDPASEQILNEGLEIFPNTNDLSTDFTETEWVWGNRYELGYVNDQHGWMIGAAHVHNYHQVFTTSAFANIAFFDPFNTLFGFVDLNGDGIDDDVNGNGIFGDTRPFNFDQGTPTGGIPPFIPPQDGILDTFVGTDFADQVVFPVFFQNVLLRNISRFSTVELMHINRLDRFHNGGDFEWLLGVRYINFTDIFELAANDPSLARVFNTAEINMRTNNHIVGPQLGFRWSREEGRWKVGTELRGVLGVNFQQARLDGFFLKAPGNTIAQGNSQAFLASRSDEELSAVGELRLDVSYQVTKAIALQIGYTGIAVSDIARSARRIDYILPAPTIKEQENNEFLFVNGFNFGVEINR
ncbi:MAG: BBP7 family outer membrane beta-barrel protein [Pirellulales bacterium]|nr:BBP7 family outer membrane beta-barrel protein [Pirellulales bacterium]